MNDLTNEEREQASDNNLSPALWVTYILQRDDGTYYVGQTNNLATRLLEHSLDTGAETTKGQGGKVKFFTHTHDRVSAKAVETRLQRTLERSPLAIEAIVAEFESMVRLVRPEKTLAELRKEEKEYESEMRTVFHHSNALMWNPGGRPPTTCGYGGFEYYSTQDWSVLKQMERERIAIESVGGNRQGRQVCKKCLALAPQDSEST
jgi:predicted GIY-YIG superfamily endonuclease